MNEIRFKSCIMPLHRHLYAYALSILSNESDAADCLQEAMTKLWENRHRLDNIENVKAYATVTVKNVAINILTRQRQKAETFSDPPPDLTDETLNTEESIVTRDQLRAVREIMKQLPENQQRVIIMSAVSGLSNNEIQQATGLTSDNVRVLLSRGRKRIRELFNKLNKDG